MRSEATIIRASNQKRSWMGTELVTPLLTGDHTEKEVSVWHARLRQGGGSPPHMHTREDEGFYIIDGEVTFLYGDGAVVAGPGSFVWGPRGTVHNFTGTSAQPANMLMIVSPTDFDTFAAGFCSPVTDEDAWPEPRPQDIETILRTAPDYGIEIKLDHPRPTVVNPAAAASKRLWVMGEHISYLATSAQTGGRFTVVDIKTAPGGGPPPHVHTNEDEIIYILAGRHEVHFDDRVEVAEPGDLVYAARGARHRYTNIDPTPGRILSIHTPGGFESFFDEAGVDADVHATPPKMDPPPPEAIAALLARHGMTM